MHKSDQLTRYFVSARDDLLRFLRRRVGGGAEDLLHEVWLRLRRRGDTAQWREPRAVLFTTAANLAADAYRREHCAEKALMRAQAWQASAAASSPGPEVELAAKERLSRLEAALAELPELARQAFLMNRLEACSHAQIARQLGVSTKSVQRYIERVLQHLTHAMDMRDEDGAL